jgi:hypothetical protein
MSENFWFKSLSSLYEGDKYLQILPTKDQTNNEILNSIFRFSIYYSVIVYFITSDTRYLYIIPMTGLFTLGLYYGSNKKRTAEIEKNTNAAGVLISPNGCIEPTRTNPFMNYNLYGDSRKELDDKEKKLACNTTDSRVKNKIRDYFDENLVREDGDIFEKNASDRQYYTMPNTDVVNDQKGFALSLYGRDKTCKENNGEQCYNNMYRYIKHL